MTDNMTDNMTDKQRWPTTQQGKDSRESYVPFTQQRVFLDNPERLRATLTPPLAENLQLLRRQLTSWLCKYNYDPAVALAAGEDHYSAFCRCWEIVYPTEYVQRVTGDGGGVRFNLLSAED